MHGSMLRFLFCFLTDVVLVGEIQSAAYILYRIPVKMCLLESTVEDRSYVLAFRYRVENVF